VHEQVMLQRAATPERRRSQVASSKPQDICRAWFTGRTP